MNLAAVCCQNRCLQMMANAHLCNIVPSSTYSNTYHALAMLLILCEMVKLLALNFPIGSNIRFSFIRIVQRRTLFQWFWSGPSQAAPSSFEQRLIFEEHFADPSIFLCKTSSRAQLGLGLAEFMGTDGISPNQLLKKTTAPQIFEQALPTRVSWACKLFWHKKIDGSAKRSSKMSLCSKLDSAWAGPDQNHCSKFLKLLIVIVITPFVMTLIDLTLFLPAMGRISPYMSVTWQQLVGIGLKLCVGPYQI